MRIDLLGLELDQALALLAGEGIQPQITATRSPRRKDESSCIMRVVYASDDGCALTVSGFMDPIADGEKAE
jgi:hypothetical protein